MNEHKRAILAAMDGGASTEVTKAALAALDALTSQKLVIKVEREDDGRWIAESPALPGFLAYSYARESAVGELVANLPGVEIVELT